MAEFEKLSLQNALSVNLQRVAANQEALYIHRDALNILYRAFFGLVNFPKEKKTIFDSFKRECAESKIDYETMRGLLDRIWGEAKKMPVDYHLSSNGPLKAMIGSMTIDLHGAESFVDPEESATDTADPIIENRIALALYERSLPTHTGLFWSFAKSFLTPYFKKYNMQVEAFSLSEDQGLLPLRMTLYSKLDNRPRNIGNFFETKLPPMNYYVNPPYSELILKKATEKADSFLRKKEPYTFMFVVPAWTDAEFYQFLLYNRHLIQHDHYDSAPVFSKGNIITVKTGFDVFVLSNQKW